MTFEEWWGGERDRALAYDLMKVLTEAAKQAWHAGHVTSIEEMLEKWNRTGVDIDAALHGRVNKESPIANRLRMIAAAESRQPLSDARLRQLHVMEEFGLFCDYEEFEQIAREIEQAHGIFQKTATGEKEQEARDVT